MLWHPLHRQGFLRKEKQTYAAGRQFGSPSVPRSNPREVMPLPELKLASFASTCPPVVPLGLVPCPGCHNPFLQAHVFIDKDTMSWDGSSSIMIPDCMQVPDSQAHSQVVCLLLCNFSIDILITSGVLHNSHYCSISCHAYFVSLVCM